MNLRGYAAVFNSRSVDMGGFVEVIKPGAFTRSLTSGGPVFALHHHNAENILGSTQSGSLRLSEDAIGLRFDLALPDSSLGRDIHELVRRGDLANMSFGFRVSSSNGEHWAERDGVVIRTLRRVELSEISTVARPAYPATSLAVRTAPANAPINPAYSRRVRLMQARLDGCRV